MLVRIRLSSPSSNIDDALRAEIFCDDITGAKMSVIVNGE